MHWELGPSIHPSTQTSWAPQIRGTLNRTQINSCCPLLDFGFANFRTNLSVNSPLSLFFWFRGQHAITVQIIATTEERDLFSDALLLVAPRRIARPPAIWLPQSLLSGGRKGLVQVYIHRCCGWLAVFLCWSVEFPLKRSGALDHVMLFLAKCRYGNGNIFGGFQSAWHWHHTSFIWRDSPVMMQFQWLTKKIAQQEWHRMAKVDKRMICKEISSL